jgi:hypothetical protein
MWKIRRYFHTELVYKREAASCNKLFAVVGLIPIKDNRLTKFKGIAIGRTLLPRKNNVKNSLFLKFLCISI